MHGGKPLKTAKSRDIYQILGVSTTEMVIESWNQGSIHQWLRYSFIPTAVTLFTEFIQECNNSMQPCKW